MGDRPDVVIVVPAEVGVDHLRRMRDLIEVSFPGWAAVYFTDEVTIYYPTADGGLDPAEPMPVLSGEDVTAYLDNLRGEG